MHSPGTWCATGPQVLPVEWTHRFKWCKEKHQEQVREDFEGKGRNRYLLSIYSYQIILESACSHALKQSTDTELPWRKVQHLLQGAKQGVQAASVQKIKLPEGFQGKAFKDRAREEGCRVCDQLMDVLLIGWWWGNWESPTINLLVPTSWDLCACGQHTVHFFHQVGVSVSAKWLKGHGSEYYLKSLRRT